MLLNLSLPTNSRRSLLQTIRYGIQRCFKPGSNRLQAEKSARIQIANSMEVQSSFSQPTAQNAPGLKKRKTVAESEDEEDEIDSNGSSSPQPPRIGRPNIVGFPAAADAAKHKQKKRKVVEKQTKTATKAKQGKGKGKK